MPEAVPSTEPASGPDSRPDRAPAAATGPAPGAGAARPRSRWLGRAYRSVSEAGEIQIIVAVLVVIFAVLIARFSWTLPDGETPTPLTNAAERAFYDMRAYYSADMVEQDDRVVVVVFTDEALFDLKKRSPLPRDTIASALKTLDSLNPAAIGIDILFDQPQDEDEVLIETLRNMQTPVAVAYADTETNENDIIKAQQEYLDWFMAQLEGSNARKASVRLNQAFGQTRVWPDIEQAPAPLLGRAMLADAGAPIERFAAYEGAIDYRRSAFEDQTGSGGDGSEEQVSVELFPSFDIQLFAGMDADTASFFADQIEGRYVLLGGDLVDVDRKETTFTSVDGREPAGIYVHAHMIAQMLDGNVMPQISSAVKWALALLVVLSAVLVALLEWPARRLVPFMVLLFGVFIGVPIVLQVNDVDTYRLPAVGWLLGWVLAFTAMTTVARASGARQRSFAQSALGKYIPRDIAQAIIDKPELLSLGGEKRAIYVLFSDLEGFTKMSHAIPPEMVAKLLNRYLEMLSQVVLDHGGVIDKFVGDAVVAFWGAPISRPDDGTRAAKAGHAIWEAGEAFRREVAEMDPSLPRIGKTRVGLHHGEAVIGNFGGDTRIQYTALGDSMNTAARLESANKALKSSVMASREFAEGSQLDWWREMGRIVLSGRSSPVDIMEPAPHFPVEDRALLAEAATLAASDPARAQAIAAEVAARHPDDEALANLAYRYANLFEGGAYVMGSK
ncbi:MAG: adenylate/guanylate cyclase domain-containing protein [Erythrobacter sp.]|jgi:adenylate cyclase|nr:adenylate/guanylate cyclase domain-containing protein [Erythrobacter sp.]